MGDEKPLHAWHCVSIHTEIDPSLVPRLPDLINVACMNKEGEPGVTYHTCDVIWNQLNSTPTTYTSMAQRWLEGNMISEMPQVHYTVWEREILTYGQTRIMMLHAVRGEVVNNYSAYIYSLKPLVVASWHCLKHAHDIVMQARPRLEQNRTFCIYTVCYTGLLIHRWLYKHSDWKS